MKQIKYQMGEKTDWQRRLTSNSQEATAIGECLLLRSPVRRHAGLQMSSSAGPLRYRLANRHIFIEPGRHRVGSSNCGLI